MGNKITSRKQAKVTSIISPSAEYSLLIASQSSFPDTLQVHALSQLTGRSSLACDKSLVRLWKQECYARYVYSFLGFMVCGCFIIHKKRRRRYLIVESMGVRSSVQGSRLSNNKHYRYREDRSRCRIGSYTPRILDFSDLPPQSSTPIDAGAMTAFSFDGHGTIDNPLLSPPGSGDKASRSMTRMSYFSNATEIVGKGSSRSTL